MANFLATPAWWDDTWPYDVGPPAMWNGTSYAKVGEEFTAEYVELAPSTAYPNPTFEDVVAGTVTASNRDSLPMYLVYSYWDDDAGLYTIYDYVLVDGTTSFSFTAMAGGILSLSLSFEEDSYNGASGYYGLNFSLVPSTTPPTPKTKHRVYEMEKGWSFDGDYIPHMLELNWLFGDNPVDFTGMQKIRIHGLAKGQAKLQVAVNSMETDGLDYEAWYSEPQHIDLPRHTKFVQSEYYPVTNYVDTAARGLSVQMKFTGRNENLNSPEPSHVIQVLVLQTTNTGARSN